MNCRMSIYSVVSTLCMASILFAGSCTDDFSALNENPNATQDANTAYLLSGAQTNLMDEYWGIFPLGYFGNPWTQYWSHNQYTDESRYQFREAVNSEMWEEYYTAITDLQQIINLNTESPDEYSVYGDPENQIAVAMIMRAWTFQTITDTWGSAPYSEAIQGSENPSPAYDPQEEIYVGIIETLTQASEQINPEGTISGDLIYDGEMEMWRRFANSLKMRAAIRIADRDPELAATAIEEALAAGPFTSNEDNALFEFQASEPYTNPIYENYEVQGRDDWAMSDAIIGLMTSTDPDDPRLPSYATLAEDCECYDGFEYGLSGGDAAAVPRNSFSRPGLRVREATAPAILMLYDEVLFIQAEAAQRGFITGDPATLYEDAIAASMEYWDVTDQAAIDDYIATVPYDAANWQQVLGEQKWLALYMQGLQGWSEWRRLDFTGVLEPPADPLFELDSPNNIAIRRPYPFTEETLNGANLQEAIEQQGPDELDTPLWWDVEQ